MNKLTVLEGEISEIIYYNDDSGYTVCEILADGKSVTLVGNMPYIASGELVRAQGCWTSHPDYGRQFRAEKVERTIPKSVGAILAYLASGVLPGIREATAKKIVDKFGESSLDVIRSNPDLLTSIKGISLNKADAVSEAFLLRQDAAEAVMFLQGYGVSPALALKVYKRFGQTAVEVIKDNPYCLCDSVAGIGFPTADRIASEMGFAKNHDGRLKSGVAYVLSAAAVAGHSCLPAEVLRRECARVLGVDSEDAASAADALIRDAKIVPENGCLYLPNLYNAELYCARRLRSLSRELSGMKNAELLSEMHEFARHCKIALSPEQQEAVETVNRSGLMIITGGPGTGKTTIINTIIHVMKKQGLDIALAAPTGKAAKRLSEACGEEAKTLHRLLEVNRVSDGSDSHFSRNEEFPLEADVIIVDEMSMVDILLMSALLKAVKKGARLIMAGDVDQLPSVGAGNVLKDMIKSGELPIVRLKEVFRQASQSMIVLNAHRINAGEYPILNQKDKDFFFMPRLQRDADKTILELLQTRLPKRYGFDPKSDIQVLSPSRRGQLGVFALNRLLQESLNPPARSKSEKKFGDTLFRVGDKVMQTKNDYNLMWSKKDNSCEGLGIYNGDIGIITSISRADGVMTVEFDDERTAQYDVTRLEDLELAYALTVHKAQGCEFRAVVMPVSAFAPMLITRNLLYTAITRARELVVLVGAQEYIAKMVANNREAMRYSGLCERIKTALT